MQLSHVLKRKHCARHSSFPPGWNAAVGTAISDLAEEGGPLGCQNIKRGGAWATDNSMEQSSHHGSGFDMKDK